MEEDTVVALPRPGAGVTDDPLLAVLREGARRMLMQAIEAERGAFRVETFLAVHAGLVDGQGRRRVVRNGHAPERQIQTGIGPVEVRRPKLRDRIPGEDASRIRRRPGIFARVRSVALNILRAHGVANVSEAIYTNALSLDRLLVFGHPKSEN